MKFSPQIIARILGFLDNTKDLKNCLLVSKEFREVIIKTSNLMQKLDVILFGNNWMKKLIFINKYGEYVIGLKIQSVEFRSEDEILGILKLMPNIERLECSNLDIDNDYSISDDEGTSSEESMDINEDSDLDSKENSMEEDDDQGSLVESEGIEIVKDELFEILVDVENTNDCQVDNRKKSTKIPESQQIFQKLTKLDLNLGPKFHKIFIKSLKNCRTLKSLRLLFIEDDNCDYSEILSQQDNLEELHIESYDENVLRTVFNRKIHENRKIQLKKLFVHGGLTWNENFLLFIKSQSECVKHLELLCYKLNFRYFHNVLTHYKTLESFSFYVDNLLTEERVEVVRNHRLESVKFLELQGRNYDLTTFKVLINIFPNIETLKLESLTFFALEGILDNFKNLTALKVDSFSCQPMINVSLPKLIVLEIACLYKTPISTLWDMITSNCPNIEQLKIDNIFNLLNRASVKTEYSKIFRSLNNLKNLKFFKINIINDEEGWMVVENENFDVPNYLVQVDTEKMLIKSSRYFSQHCEDEMNILREIFGNYNIEEI